MLTRFLKNIHVKRTSPNLLRNQATYLFLFIIIYIVLLTDLLIKIILIEERPSNSTPSASHIKRHTNAFIKDIHQAIHRHRLFREKIKGQPEGKNLILQKVAEERLPGVGTPIAQDGVWQSVAGTRFKFFVFSAYYDPRETRMIRIIGVTRTLGPGKVWCRLWYQDATYPGVTNHSITVAGRVTMIQENWLLQYSACFVRCRLDTNQSLPSSVSVVKNLNLFPTNRMLLHQYNTGHPHQKMTACVKPLHYDYNKSLSMVEFIELNRLLGIEHIYFYNDTMSPSTGCVLDAYAAEGRVTVLPWQLNMASQKEIRTEGMFAALNDCLYRSMYSYSHVAFVDLDEFIMPQHNETLFQLIDWLNQQTNTSGVASYSFQNAFFYLQWNDDASQTVHNQSKLVTLSKTRRRKELHEHDKRSKYICRPEFVVEAGNHFVWKFIPGYGTLNVQSDAAMLNHYRVCELGGDDCIRSASVVDRTAFRYRDQLIANVHQRWNSIKSDCNLEDLMIEPRTVIDTETVDLKPHMMTLSPPADQQIH